MKDTTVHDGLITKIGVRSGAQSRYGDLKLLHKERLVVGPEGDARLLTEFEFQILWILVRSQGAFVHKDEIIHFVYEDRTPQHNNIEVFVSRIRRKLATIGSVLEPKPRYKFGYVLM